MQRFRLPVLAGAMLLACAGLGGRASAQAPGYRLYTNPKGYQLDVPSTWIQGTPGGATIDVSFSAADHGGNLLVQSQDFPLKPDPQVLISGILSDMTKDHPDSIVAPIVSVSKVGADAAKDGIALYTDSGIHWDLEVTAMSKGNRLYSLSTLQTSDYSLSHSGEQTHIVNSFVLTDVASFTPAAPSPVSSAILPPTAPAAPAPAAATSNISSSFPTSFVDGTYIVGTDIASGTYRAAGFQSDSCGTWRTS